VDGDCAGRLLAYMIDELGWFELGDFPAAGGGGGGGGAGEDAGLDGEVQRAVELLCASEGRLTPPLVALVLDYAGRAQLCFRRFMAVEDAKGKDKEGAANAARARQAVMATVAASRVRIQGGVVVQPPDEQQQQQQQEAKGDAKGA
jgi:hypothetical protein